MSETAFATNEAAMLEPLAIEQFRYGAFSYVIGASETKWCVNAWATRLGSAGRFDVRDPRQPIPLRNVTMTGLQSTSTGVFIDPTLATYADPTATVFDRMATIPTLKTRYVSFASGETYQPLLPGPYGSILVGYSFHDTTWLVARGPQGPTAGGWNLWNEISDAAADDMRVGHRLYVPVSKNVLSGISRGAAGGPDTPLGGVIFVDVPSTWGEVVDANTYSLRDDFMGTSLNTASTWTRVESTAGNVEIDSVFSALYMKGNGTWGANGLFSQTGVTRAAGLRFQADVLIGSGNSNNPNLILGFHDGAGQSFSDFAHGLYFTSGPNIQIFENGTSRGVTVSGTGFTANCLYRVRLTLAGASGCTYEIQGGPEYQPIGSTSWTNVSPGTSSSATGTLHMGASINGTNGFARVSDMKIYS